MKDGIDTVFAILTAVIGVAIISVLVSQNSQTPQVIQAFASAFGNILGVVVKPVGMQSSAAAGGAGMAGSNPRAVIDIPALHDFQNQAYGGF